MDPRAAPAAVTRVGPRPNTPISHRLGTISKLHKFVPSQVQPRLVQTSSDTSRAASMTVLPNHASKSRRRMNTSALSRCVPDTW